MREPSVRTSRLALAGGIAVVLIAGGGGFLLGRGTSERQVAIAPQIPIATPRPVTAPEKPPGASSALNRSDLVALAADAADALAADRAIPADILKAEGRRFDVRLPFGCQGAADKDSIEPMRWRYDEDKKALRLHVAPVVWAARDWWSDAATAPDAVEVIEGFWINRPWTGSEECPSGGQAVASRIEPATPTGQTLALAQFFRTDDSRQGRRDGKAFETVLRVEPEALQIAQGFRLRLSGKIANVPGGSPALCRQPGGPEQRPICVIATVVSEFAIENGATGEVLATWSSDRKDSAAAR